MRASALLVLLLACGREEPRTVQQVPGSTAVPTPPASLEVRAQPGGSGKVAVPGLPITAAVGMPADVAWSIEQGALVIRPRADAPPRIVRASATLSTGATIPLFAAVAGAPGSLDTSFGDGGIATFSLTGGAHGNQRLDALALLPDGSVVAGGYAQPLEHKRRLAVLKVTPAGALDPSFGKAGVVYIDALDGEVEALAPRPDGSIWVAGDYSPGRGSYLVLARLLADGSLDVDLYPPSGLKELHFPRSKAEAASYPRMHDVEVFAGDPNNQPRAILATADGGALVVGSRIVDTNDYYDYEVYLARLDERGRLDARFGHAGLVFSYPTFGRYYAGRVMLQPDGKILTSGYETRGRHIFAQRFLADGRIDSTFGEGGITRLYMDTAFGLALDSAGRVLLARGGEEPVVRLTAGGRLDTTWHPAPSGQPVDVFVEPDGNVVTAGVVLTRYLPSGQLNRSFGGGTGAVTTQIGPGGFSVARAAREPGGRLVLAAFGKGSVNERPAVMIARYWL